MWAGTIIKRRSSPWETISYRFYKKKLQDKTDVGAVDFSQDQVGWSDGLVNTMSGLGPWIPGSIPSSDKELSLSRVAAVLLVSDHPP